MKKISKHYKLLISLDQRHTARQRIIGGILRWSMIHMNWDVEFACEPLGGHSDLRKYLDWGADALIIDESHENLTDAELLKISGGRVVFANCRDRKIKGLLYAILGSDDETIGRRAAEILIKNGLTNFAFVPWSSPSRWSNGRGQNFVRFVESKGFKASVVNEISGEALSALPKPCGVFCANDIRARQVILECGRSGIAVPKDIQVLGVDDNEFLCDNTDPSISSVLPEFDRGGFISADWLSKQINKPCEPPAKPDLLVFPCIAVIERLSTCSVNATMRYVDVARTFIRKNGLKNISVKDVAGAAGVSVSLLQRDYPKITGRTMVEELIQVRLNETKRLLRKTTMPIESIHTLCGFKSSSYLKNLFKRRIGKTMSAFRAQ